VLYRIARTDPVWIEAQVYEADLPLLSPGMAAVVTSPYAAGARRGRVAFIGPALTGDARTAVARVELPNPGALLKPGMFVDVTLEAHLGRRLVVPQDAVVPTGERNFVFVDKGGGRIEPRAVTLGARAGEWTEIAVGLSSGETVVTSGNFLVAADARLKSAIDQWQARP
jgi:Cu(I)/Ag(I) efflux system membrane fusion protein